MTIHLPHSEQVSVPRDKLGSYLLNPVHPIGREKAVFFRALGFNVENWMELAEALRRHAHRHPVAKEVETPRGRKFTVDGELEAPDGRSPRVRSVWMIDRNHSVPRLVTAYPL